MQENSDLSALDPYEPITHQFIQEPHSRYKALRDYDPVFKSPISGIWLVTGYDANLGLLKDWRLSSSASSISGTGSDDEKQSLACQSNWMIKRDPPVHTRLRRLMKTGFTNVAIDELREPIEQIATELICKMKKQRRVEFVADFATQLPLMVLFRLLGVPEHEQAEFFHWAQALTSFAEPKRPGDEPPMYKAVVEAMDYFQALLTQRKLRPQEGFLDRLLAADGQATMTMQETVDSCVMLLFAGHETVFNFISNGLFVLLKHPDQLEQIRSQPQLISKAIEELLRFDGPIQAVARVAKEAFTFAGKEIGARDVISLQISAANRDPAKFAEPDRFDIKRINSGEHLAFGHGIHHCLGASLARLEAAISFSMLLEEFPNLRLIDDTIVYNPSIALRGPRELPLEF